MQFQSSHIVQLFGSLYGSSINVSLYIDHATECADHLKNRSHVHKCVSARNKAQHFARLLSSTLYSISVLLFFSPVPRLSSSFFLEWIPVQIVQKLLQTLATKVWLNCSSIFEVKSTSPLAFQITRYQTFDFKVFICLNASIPQLAVLISTKPAKHRAAVTEVSNNFSHFTAPSLLGKQQTIQRKQLF